MVHGIKKFKEYFENHSNQYVLIGGTACDILMDDLGVPFRATKDFDMVLIIENLDLSFGKTFWKFVEDGGYSNRKRSTGKRQYYRFTKPEDSSFPKMIELFSRHPNNFQLNSDKGLTPIYIDETIASLSAILLNDAYYDLLIEGNITVDGFSIIDIETLILFKVKAWLDLKRRRESGNKVDSKDIKKHKNDVFRLLVNVSPTARIKTVEVVQKDINQFVKQIQNNKPDINNLGIRGTNFRELMNIFKNTFLNIDK